MKRNENFIMQKVAEKTVIVPVGKAASDFYGMLSVNETGSFLWDLLEQEQTIETLTQALTERYAVEAEKAQADVKAFIEKISHCGAICE